MNPEAEISTLKSRLAKLEADVQRLTVAQATKDAATSKRPERKEHVTKVETIPHRPHKEPK